MDGYMSAPRGLSRTQRHQIERFAGLAGIGPIFRTRPHRGQHGFACLQCSKTLKPAKAKPQPRQPWEAQV
jgi:hypothetical protein